MKSDIEKPVKQKIKISYFPRLDFPLYHKQYNAELIRNTEKQKHRKQWQFILKKIDWNFMISLKLKFLITVNFVNLLFTNLQ